MYHALNRAVARLPLFEKEADFEAFERVMEEGRRPGHLGKRSDQHVDARADDHAEAVEGGQPQAEAPRGRQCGPARKGGVALDDRFHVPAADDHHLGADDGDEVCDAHAEAETGLFVDLLGNGIAIPGGPADNLSVTLFKS